MVKSIPGDVPKNLALSIAISEASAFVTSWRNSILLNTPGTKLKTLVPTNSYIFSLSPSGVSKDRTKNTLTKLLAGGYAELDKLIKLDLIDRAKQLAIDSDDEEANFYQYMQVPIDPAFKFGTAPGVSKKISDIGNKQSFGSPILVSSEIGQDLSARGDELIKTFTILSDLYDLGTVKFDTLKTEEARVDPVTNLPVNFLVFGSEKGILMDSANKKKFKSFFNQQLARRCLFSFTTHLKKEPLARTIEERKAKRHEITEITGDYYDEIYNIFSDLGSWMPNNINLTVSEEADNIFEEYKNYNELLSDTMEPNFPISKLARAHKQWLALKLSGIYAMLDKSIIIEVRHYIDAINTVELLAPDLERFELELDKEPYEILDSYCRNNTIEGYFHISLHQLKKLNFIEGKTGIESRLKELVVLLNDFSTEGIYSIEGSILNYEETISTEVVGVSLLAVDTSSIQNAVANKKSKDIISQLKQELSWTAIYGYDFVEKDPEGNDLRFEDYKYLLEDDYAYTPFKLKEKDEAVYDVAKHPNAHGGIRGKDNIARR